MHSLLIGMIECGKSCLGKNLARSYIGKGKKVLVLDPIMDDWGNAEVTDSTEELEQWMRASENRASYVFIDEGGEVFNEGRERRLNWLTTRSRHYGHSVHILAQRYVQIPPTVRGQCNRLYLFTVSRQDAEEAAIDWNKPELRNAHLLPKLHFYIVGRYEKTRLGVITGENYDNVRILDAGNFPNSTDTNSNGLRTDSSVAIRRQVDKRT